MSKSIEFFHRQCLAGNYSGGGGAADYYSPVFDVEDAKTLEVTVHLYANQLSGSGSNVSVSPSMVHPLGTSSC